MDSSVTSTQDFLILLEHPHVYTLGKGVTLLQKELGREIDRFEVKKVYVSLFDQMFKS